MPQSSAYLATRYGKPPSQPCEYAEHETTLCGESIRFARFAASERTRARAASIDVPANA